MTVWHAPCVHYSTEHLSLNRERHSPMHYPLNAVNRYQHRHRKSSFQLHHEPSSHPIWAQAASPTQASQALLSLAHLHCHHPRHQMPRCFGPGPQVLSSAIRPGLDPAMPALSCCVSLAGFQMRRVGPVLRRPRLLGLWVEGAGVCRCLLAIAATM